jgi:hypothetical protein
MNPSWFQSIDSYCERLDPSFWAEPVNAASNGFFLLAAVYAFWLWRQEERPDWPSLWLIAVTAIVGVGSFLFHTFANRWSLLADVLPIAVFIYSYFLLAMRRFLLLGMLSAAAITVAFIAFNLSFTRLWFSLFPGVSLNGSVGYLPAMLAMFTVGLVCWASRSEQAGKALLWAGSVFAVSLFFRSIDSAVCSALPLGTHALWHMLNALVLWTLMTTVIRHAPEKRPLHVSG